MMFKRKTLLTAIVLLASSEFSFCQTNTFPSSGNVGIGTTSPTYNLDVHGSLRNYFDTAVFESSTNGRTIVLNPGGFTIDFENGNGAVGMINREVSTNLSINAGGGNLLVGYPTGSSTSYKEDINGNTRVAGNLIATGDAGIGTLSPTATLSINNSSGTLFNATSNSVLRVNTTNLGITTYYLNNGNGEAGSVDITTPLGHPGFVLFTGSSYNENRFNLFDEGSYFGLGYNALSTSQLPATLNITDSGYVGIGTTTPAATFEVDNSVIAANEPVAILARSAGDSNFHLETRKGVTTNNNGDLACKIGLVYQAQENSMIEFFRGESSTGGFMAFTTNDGTERMRIDGSGNVLIGKTSETNSSYKLDVNGNARVNKLVVNTTGADYVFDPGYHLKPLVQLHHYVETYHHLPGIPSSDNMEKNGNDVGNTQMKLLAKVEELTLYLIKEDSVINQQQAEIKNLEKEMNLLKEDSK
jgi:hypothetical protein